MLVRRSGQVCLALAITLAGLIFHGTNSVRAADLSKYLSPDFCGVLVIHPQRISESTLVEALKSGLPKELAKGDPTATAMNFLKNQKNLPPGMDLEKLTKLVPLKSVQRVVLVIDSALYKTTPESAFIVQFSDDIDGEAILAAIASDWKPAETNGVKYKKLKGQSGQPDGAALAPDSRTLIIGVESTVVKMLVKEQGDRPLLRQLQHASFDNDIVFEFFAAPFWAGLTKSTGKSIDEILAAEPDPAAAAVAKDIKSVSIRVNFSGKTLLRSEVTTGTPETAAKLAAKAQEGVTEAKKQYEKFKKQPPPGPMVFLMPMITRVADEGFEGLEIKADEGQMTVTLATPKSLPDTLRSVGQMASMFLQQPPPGAKQPPMPGDEK